LIGPPRPGARAARRLTEGTEKKCLGQGAAPACAINLGRADPYTQTIGTFYPTSYVLDAKGVIRYTEIRGEELEKAVNVLLKEAETRIAG
jgi:hypothetical protein